MCDALFRCVMHCSGDLLVQQATCVIGMHQAVENLKGKLQRHKQEVRCTVCVVIV